MSDSMDPETKRELLERSANRTRERLLGTLSELDQRRHDLTDDIPGVIKEQVVKQVDEHKKPIAITGGALVLGVSVAIGVSIYRLATRRSRLRRERWKALQRYWDHPERLARRNPPKGSTAADIGRKILTSALTYAALEITKRSVRGALSAGDDPTALGSAKASKVVVVRTLPA